MTLYLLVVFLFLGFSPAFSQQDPCPALQQRTANWMQNLRQDVPNQASPNALGNQPLRNILFGGSHDAGLNIVVNKNPQAAHVDNVNFITQTFSIAEQLCLGARWFDLRFALMTDPTGLPRWRIFHGETAKVVGFPIVDGPIAYGPDLVTVMNQLAQFLATRRSEIVFVRIKLKSGNAERNDFAQRWREILGGFMLGPGNNNNGIQLLPDLTLNQIWNTVGLLNRAHLVVLAKDWAPPNQLLGHIWNYADVQGGDYSDASNTHGVFGNCKNGQQVRLNDFKSRPANAPHLLYGVWWTFTGSILASQSSDPFNVRANTMSRNIKYPYGLNDFYIRNRGEIGNFIIIDFFGDVAGGALDVMNFVIDYNRKKYINGNIATTNMIIRDAPPFPNCVRANGNREEIESSDNYVPSQGLSGGQIAGIVIGSVAFVVLVVAAFGYVLFSKASRQAEIP